MSGDNGKNRPPENKEPQPEPRPQATIIAQLALTDDGRVALKSHLLKQDPISLTHYLATALNVASAEAVKAAPQAPKILQPNMGMIGGMRQFFNKKRR